MRALGDLPSQVKLAIYQLIAFEDRSKAELVFPSFKEIAQQLELETAGAGLMLMTDDCEHAPMLSQMLLDDDMLSLLPTTEFDPSVKRWIDELLLPSASRLRLCDHSFPHLS